MSGNRYCLDTCKKLKSLSEEKEEVSKTDSVFAAYPSLDFPLWSWEAIP